jgi:hypothetical protein
MVPPFVTDPSQRGKDKYTRKETAGVGEINICWDMLIGSGGWLQLKISLPAAPGAYFDHRVEPICFVMFFRTIKMMYFCMCLAICVPEVPCEVGVGGRGRGQGTRIFHPGKPLQAVGQMGRRF